MRVPFSDRTIFKVITIHEYVIENGKYVVRCVPKWPCLERDGAGASMYFDLELIFIDKHGTEYEVKELTYD